MTQNNVVKKKADKDKKGVLHEYLKENPHAEPPTAMPPPLPKRASVAAAAPPKKKKASGKEPGRQSLAEYMKKFT